MSSPAPSGVPTSAGLRRDMEVLRELASVECLDRGGLGVVRIAVRLGREKSQVSRALRALEGEGLVQRNPRTRTYRLGWGLYTLASRGIETRLVRAASAHLYRLADEQRANARLCVLIGSKVLTLTSVPADRAAGPEEPTRTPCGPVLALDWPEAALADLVPDDAPGDNNLNSLDSLLTGCTEARERGYVRFPATDAGPARYAAPIRGFKGIVLAAAELTPLPDEDPSAGSIPPGQATANAARALSADLGFRG